ncbi:MAG: response regulator [Caldilineaceae bacterium]
MLQRPLNGAEVLPLLEEYKPDVLVLDIEMPHPSGVSESQIKLQQLPVRILALSAHDDEGIKAQGFTQRCFWLSDERRSP